MGEGVSRDQRIAHEREHSVRLIADGESNWGWHTPAGQIRRLRRVQFLTSVAAVPVAHLKVLEVGCGTGTFTGDLAQKFADLTAIDVAPLLIERARSKFPQVQFQVEDAHHTQFPAEHFDVIVGCSVLHHLEWPLALNEFFRILKPGGEIRFSEPNLLNPQIFLQKKWPYLKKKMGDSPDESAFTQAQIVRDLRRSGFVHIHSRPTEFLHPSTPESCISLVTRLESLLEKSPAVHIAGSLFFSAQKPRPGEQGIGGG